MYSFKNSCLAAGLTLTTLIALAAAPAHAQIVKDGGFETADPSQTTQTDFFSDTPFDTNWAVTGEVGVDQNDTYVFSGSKSLYLNSGIGTDSISQTLATATGGQYNLSFYANDDTPGDVLNVLFGDTTLAPIAVPANGYNGPGAGNQGRFTFYSYNVVATSPSTGLTFSSVGGLGSGVLELDGISVTPGFAPVPEASTLVSLALLLGLGEMMFAAKKVSTKKAAQTV